MERKFPRSSNFLAISLLCHEQFTFSWEISSLVQTYGLFATPVDSTFKSKPAKPYSATPSPHHRSLKEMLGGDFYRKLFL
jgi:hypothetical protein